MVFNQRHKPEHEEQTETDTVRFLSDIYCYRSQRVWRRLLHHFHLVQKPNSPKPSPCELTQQFSKKRQQTSSVRDRNQLSDVSTFRDTDGPVRTDHLTPVQVELITLTSADSYLTSKPKQSPDSFPKFIHCDPLTDVSTLLPTQVTEFTHNNMMFECLLQ